MKTISKSNKIFSKQILVAVILFIVLTAITFFAFYNQRPYYSEQFIADLEAQGAKIEGTQNGASDFVFFINGTILNVSGQKVQYFEYATTEHANYLSSRVSENGYTIRGAKITWKASPHLFQKNNFIVLYVGNNTQILQHLENIFGEQFAGTEYSLIEN